MGKFVGGFVVGLVVFEAALWYGFYRKGQTPNGGGRCLIDVLPPVPDTCTECQYISLKGLNRRNSAIS